MNTSVLDKVTGSLWVLLVLALPLSSLPLVAKLTGTSYVAPGSLLFLIPLALIFIPVMLTRRYSIPVLVKPMLAFSIFALLTIFLAFFRDVPDYKDQTIIRAALEGSVTLGLGSLFYITAASYPNTSSRITTALKVINLAGLVVIVWTCVQFTAKVIFPEIRPVIREIQSYLSVTRNLQYRMVAFAYEPSWLAHMLNLTFLPYWLASTITRTSAFRLRLWKFTTEDLLLIGGIGVLVGTLSRGGLAAFMLVVTFLFILLNIKFLKWLSGKWVGRKRNWMTAFFTVSLILLYLVVLVGGLFIFSKVDPRMAGVFNFTYEKNSPILEYAESLQFGERMVYWLTGWNIFNTHPILGVGVGMSGFYFPDNLPDIGWQLSESRRLLYRSSELMNIKNLWSRLLAETGIVGFSLFLSFLLVSLSGAVSMVKSGEKKRRALGFMGVFILIALIFEGFSLDSFALPYIWFGLGLNAAAWRWYYPGKGDVNG